VSRAAPFRARARANGGLVTYAPQGGYTNEAFTHGVQVGVAAGSGQNLAQSTNELIQGFRQSNPNLRRAGNNVRTTVAGRNGLMATLTNVGSNGEREVITLSTATLSDGSTLFVLGVAPENEARTYRAIFNRVSQQIVVNDR
jgi:hypothetical protein